MKKACVAILVFVLFLAACSPAHFANCAGQKKGVVPMGISSTGGINYIHFDGAIPYAGGLSIKTVTFWINQAGYTVDTYAISISKPGSATDEFWIIRLNHNANGAVELFVNFSTTAGDWEKRSNILGTGTWHHVAISYDATNVSNNPSLYLDGVLQTSFTRWTAPVGSVKLTGATTLRILGETADSVNGGVEDYRVYNRALSASEIAALAAVGRTLEMNDNGLVFHAPLLIATGMTPPWNGVALTAGNLLVDRINCLTGVPVGTVTGQADAIYGTGY